MSLPTPKVIAWFSCGAASFAATSLALLAEARGELPYGAEEVVIAYCDVLKREHPDNVRFMRDCERYWRRPVLILGNDEFDRDPHRVFDDTGFLVGVGGARCTTELKKKVRWGFQRPHDVMILGYTVEEHDRRLEQLRQTEPVTRFWSILNDRGLTKQECLAMVMNAGIDLPEMYKLGYRNNNCIGCVKGQAGYWNKIRVDFPEVFADMAARERRMGRTICKKEWRTPGGGRHLERVYLDEMDPNLGDYKTEPDISCGVLCQGLDEEMDDMRVEGLV